MRNFMVLVLALLLGLAQIADATYSQKLDCLPGLDGCNDDYPDLETPPGYSDYESKRLAPGVALAIFCVLVCCVIWWCWCCCRCWARCGCCGCCRWWLCECCCGAGTSEARMVYTKCQRMALLVVLVVAFLMLALGGILGWLGGHRTYDGALDLMTQSITAVDDMNSLNTNVAQAAFLSLGQFYGGSVTYDASAVTGTISDVKDLLNDAKDAVTNIKDIFDYALPGFYGLFVATTVLGCFSWLCGVGCLSMTMGMCSSVLLLFAWLLFAVFWLTGSFLDDTCVQLAEHYYLDCMKKPGYTCPQAKLTELFQCPKLTTVSKYYADAFNLLDSAASNGAGTNSYGSAATMINKGYGNTALSNYNSYGTAVTPLAPAVHSGTELGMEPYTTCKTTYSFSNTDGNRRDTCTSGSSNTGQIGPQNTAQTVSSYQTTGLTADSGSTNPPWAASTDTGRTTGDSIGTCERACLNSTADSGSILDSATNFGGNCMFRKFLYETFTSVYSSGNQGYAKCSADIKWKDNTNIAEYATYQNFSGWMTSYSNMANSGSECVSSTHCVYSGSNREIPWTASGGTNPACYQAAAMAAADILFALSYIGSCHYIKTFALLTSVQSTGACHDLGDGLVYLIMAQGLIGAAMFITIVVGVMGYRRWNSDYDAGSKKAADEKEDSYEDVGFNCNDDPQDQHAPYVPEGIETELSGVGTSDGALPKYARTHDAWV